MPHGTCGAWARGRARTRVSLRDRVLIGLVLTGRASVRGGGEAGFEGVSVDGRPRIGMEMGDRGPKVGGGPRIGTETGFVWDGEGVG